MKRLSLLLAIFFSLVSTNAFGKVKITGVDLNKLENGMGRFVIHMEDYLDETPELTVKNQMIQVEVPGSYVWPKIEKQATVNGNFDTKLMAYQFNKDLVRVRAMLPFSMASKQDNVSVTLKGKRIEVEFPLLKTKKVAKANKKANTKYDESYLNKLLKDVEKSEVKKVAAVPAAVAVKKQNPPAKQDKVSFAMAANEKKSSNGFSLMSYIGKFAAFLGLILLGFYGVVQMMKKGAFKKGKLGFLNSTKVVEVLNTTYVAPKRSLMVVKAHNQVFLIGNSEKGMDLISELSDVTGLIKTGEKELSGSNFDTNLNSAEKQGKDFKLKEILDANSESAHVENQANLNEFLSDSQIQDKVKLSDQIKNKVKNLKSLQ